MARLFTLDDAIHHADDAGCPACLDGYPEPCPCGGSIHATGLATEEAPDRGDYGASSVLAGRVEVSPADSPVMVEVPTPTLLEAASKAREEAERYVQTLAGRLRAEGLDAEPQTKYGEPTRIILDTVRELRVELIAMTTHGRSGLGRLLFGSIAEDVLRHSPVPVFLVRVSEEETASQAA